MIVLLIAASLSQSEATFPSGARPAPCHAAPSLCLSSGRSSPARLTSNEARANDAKMTAYRFDARPCRIVGAQCVKRADRQLFRLGEPVGQTLMRSFGID